MPVSVRVADLTEHGLRDRLAGPGLAWRVGPFRIRLRTRLRDVGRDVAFLYGAFPVVEPGCVVDVEVWVGCGRLRRDRVTLRVDGETVYERMPRRQAAALLEWTLNMSVFQRPNAFFLIHSATLARRGRALLMPGHAGSGKSTLCAALMHRGWRLLSDEVAPVRPPDGRVLPVPRAVSLKDDSIAAIRRIAPQATIGRRYPGTVKGTVAHVLPDPDAVARADEPAEPAWIVFPGFRPGAETTLSPVTRANALFRIADNSFNYSALGEVGFETAADLVDRCACFEMTFGDLADAVGRLDALD